MHTVVQESLGGRITYDGEGRLHCQCRGLFISGMIGIALVVFGGLAIAMIVLVAAGVMAPAALPSIVAPGIFVAYWSALLRFRVRRMGTFVVDTPAGVIRKLRGTREVETWPLRDVRFGSVWDPFHRGWGMHHWITAQVEPKRRLRLGKGTKDEVLPVLRLLAELGQPVEGSG